MDVEEGRLEGGQQGQEEQRPGDEGEQGQTTGGDPKRSKRGELEAAWDVADTDPCTEVASAGTCGRTPTKRCITCSQPRCRVHLTRCSDARCVRAQTAQDTQQSVPKPRVQQKKKKAKGAGGAARAGGKH